MASNGTPAKRAENVENVETFENVKSVEDVKDFKDINGSDLNADTEATLQFFQKTCEQISLSEPPDIKTMIAQWRNSISFCQKKLDRWVSDAPLVNSSKLLKANKADTKIYLHQFQDLPAEIHFELTKYLAASDIKNLSSTGSKIRLVYCGFRWTKCVVLPDEKPEMVMHYLRSELEDCYSAHDPVPLRVFQNPTKFGWFMNKRVEKLLLCAHIDQKCQVDRGMFSTPFRGDEYPNLEFLNMVPQLDLNTLYELLDSPFIKTLRKVISKNNESANVPFWDLRILDYYRCDLKNFLSCNDLRMTLRELTFTDGESITAEFIKKLELPQLVTLAIHDLDDNIYRALLHRVHFWPKLENLSFSFEYGFNGTIFYLTSATKEISELPTTLKTCNMILVEYDCEKAIRYGHEIFRETLRIEAVTWIEDSELLIDKKNNILGILDLPRLRKESFVFHPSTIIEGLNFMPVENFGEKLTHIQLKIDDLYPMPFVLWIDRFVNLRVFKIIMASVFENSDKLSNILVLLSRRLANCEHLSELELQDFFEYVVSEYDAKIFYHDLDAIPYLEEMLENPTVYLCTKLVTDPIGLVDQMWDSGFHFDKDFNYMMFMEALLVSMRTQLPALEYVFFQTTEQIYPSPGLQLLLTKPPPNIKQVLLQHQTTYPPPVLPQVEYRMSTTEFCFNNVLFDLKRKRKFPLAEQEPTVPLYTGDCMLDEFSGWI
ncbi:uncharacterized protein SAPINGB_P005037 [Magnusiomyces paraingens]|uniref:F-box domain-containing protein n=1 Tax=Magnusiomyces paraingens TaxID=2606893 RepID=A0A5E8C5D2_9ASCO|nr:uncharacterized protein SAPINGB_P005037 [Saprochaete ingens]VVT56396.1 unnamed protein product [Saprochaete ingens]